jgi:hypothetical protein
VWEREAAGLCTTPMSQPPDALAGTPGVLHGKAVPCYPGPDGLYFHWTSTTLIDDTDMDEDNNDAGTT